MGYAFDITTDCATVELGADRMGQILYTVYNASGEPVRARAMARAQQPEAQAWLSIDGESERKFTTAQTDQISLHIHAPLEAPPGTYMAHLDMIGVENPDELCVEGPTVTFVVPEPVIFPQKKPFPWWMVAAAAGLVLVIAVASALTAKGINDNRLHATQTANARMQVTGVPSQKTIRVTIVQFYCLKSDDEGPDNLVDMDRFNVWVNATNRKDADDPGVKIYPTDKAVYTWATKGQKTMDVGTVHNEGLPQSIDITFNAREYDTNSAKLWIKAYAREYDTTSSNEQYTKIYELEGRRFLDNEGKHSFILGPTDFSFRVDFTIEELNP